MKIVIGRFELQERFNHVLVSSPFVRALFPRRQLARVPVAQRPTREEILRQRAAYRARMLGLLIVAGACYAPMASHAAVKTSNGTGGGTWSTGSTWVGGIAPASTDDVVIKPGDTVAVTGNTSVNSVTFSNNLSSTAVLSVSSPRTLTVAVGITNQSAAAANTAGFITGTGAVVCPSVTVGGTTAPTGSGTVVLTSTISTLTISGGVSVIGQNNGASNNASFAIASGAVSIGGTVVFTAPAGSSATLDMTAGAQSGGLTLSSASPFSGAGTFLAAGTSATVTYSGSAQTVNPTVYNALTLSGSGVKTVTGLATVNGTMTLSGSANVTLSNALSIGGDLSIGSGTTLDVSANSYALSVGGNWNNSGTFTARAGTVTLDGTAAEAINNNTTSFSSLVIANTAATVSSTVNFNVSGTLTVNAGAVFSPAAANVINSTAAAGTLTGSGTILASRTSNTADLVNQYKFSTYSLANLAVNYSGAGNQTINSTVGSYGGLIISGSNTKTLAGAIINTGDLVISAGTLAAGANNLTVGGSWTNNSSSASFTSSGAETVTFNGASAENIGGSAATTFINLTINDAAGISLSASPTVTGTLTLTSGSLAVGANTLTLNGPAIAGTPANLSTTSASSLSFGGSSTGISVPGSVTALNNLTLNNAIGVSLGSSPVISGILTLTSGDLITGANVLGIGASGSISGAASGHYVNGSVQKAFNAGANQSFNFPIGDAINYTPVALASMTVGTAGNLMASVTAADHPQIATSGINAAQDVNRYWTLTPDGTLAASTYGATFTFVAGDVNVGATTANFLARRYNGGWSPTTTGTRASTTTQATGLSAFGDFAVGDNATDHYGVVAVSPSAGVTFITTVTAQDIFNQTVAQDGTTVVTMTATGGAQYDHNGDGVFGDNTATLTNGAFGIRTRDLASETVSLTASDANGKTGTASVVINPASGAYRSITSGAWSNPAIWQTNNGTSWVPATASPTSANSIGITVQSPNTINVMSSVTVDQVVVQAGAQVTVSNGITMTIPSGTGPGFDVFGTLENAGTVTATGTLVFESGGEYEHNFTTSDGAIPTATWSAGSTCAVVGYTTFSGNPVGGWTQSFANFVWNCPNQTAASDFSFGGTMNTVNGNFTVISTGAGDMRLGNSGGGDLTIGGNFSQTGGNFIVSGNGSRVMTVTGNYSQTGGTFNFTDGSQTVTLDLDGDFSQTGGTITETGSGNTCTLAFNKSGVQNYTSGGIQANSVNFIVNSGSTLDMGTGVIAGAGKFTLSSGATLQSGSPGGITSSGASGNVQSTGTRSFNTAANYVFDGTVAQNAGTGLPTAVNNLTIDNGAGVTLATSPTVNGTLGLSNGVLATGANTLIIPAAGVVSGASASSYVNGNLQHAFSVGNSQSYTFPIGDAANYLPLSLASMNVTHAGSITAKTVGTEQPNIATALIDTNIDVTRYWTITNASSLAATYSATLNYSANDVNAGANPAQFIAQNYNGSAWANATISGTPTTTSATISGQTAFGDFAIGGPKGNQTITFPAIGNQIYGVTPITLGATASSGLPVSYSVTGPANISSGILNITGAATVTVTASQAGSADWTAATNVAQSITVSKLIVTGSITVNNKVYDGTTSATIATRTLSQVVGSDNVALSGGTAVFSSKSIGTGKTVIVTGLSLINSSATNYTLAATSATNTANITTRPLTVTAVSNSKGYDGAFTAVALPAITSGSLATGDTSGFSETYLDKNIGTAKTLIPAGAVNDANSGSNYTVTFANANLGTITTRAITVKAVTDSRGYDGTTASAGVPTVSVGTVAAGDTAGFSQTFNNRNIGSGKTLTPAGSVTDGNNGANYAVTFSTVNTGSITARPITVSAVTDAKVYDGTAASVGVPVITSGSLGTGDTANFTQAFNNRNAAAGKTLTASGSVSDGNNGVNYNVTFASVNTGSITARPITVTAATASKSYDGTVGSAAVPTVAGGLGTGDAASFSETFDTKEVGTGKTMTPSGSVTDGNGGANYLVAFANDTASSITARAITVTGASASKVYDGTTNSAVSPAVTSGAIAVGDTGSFSQTYDTQNVGTGKLLTPIGSVNDGNGGADYTITLVPANVGAITSRPITVTAALDSKVYDATAASAGVPSVTLGNLISGDTGSFTQTFDNKNIGTNKVMTPAGSVTDGNNGANYAVTLTAANTGIITEASVNGTITASDKVYDGTNTATIATHTLTGILSNDIVQLSDGMATFDDQNVGTNKLVTATNLDLTGADAQDYTLASTTATNSASISPATLSLSIAANDKIYDGATVATLASITTNGVVGSDDVSLTGDPAQFTTKNIGTSIPVTMSNLVLSGGAVGNYQLTSATATTSANITAVVLTVSGITANPKAYDGTATASLNTASATLVGVIGSENVTLDASGVIGAFADKIAAVNKPVAISGLALAGSDDGNYTLTQPTASASISQAIVMGGITASDKVYDSTTTATIATRTLNGALISDSVSLIGGSAAFSDKNVGNGKIVTATGLSLDGGDAGNYQLASTSATNTASITQLALTVTASGVDRAYDGTAIATVTYSDNRLSNDVMTVTGTATFADAIVGNNKPVTVNNIAINGTDSANYSLTSTAAATTASITPVTLTVTADNYTRAYGATNPVLTASYAGFVNSEDTNVLQGAPLIATSADTNTPEGTYAITITNGSLSATNYAFNFVNGSLAIIPANLLFSDNFTRDTDPQQLFAPWTVQGGNWTVTGGQLNAGPNAPMTYGAAYIDTNWTDYSVEAKVQFSDLGAFGGGIGGRLNPATGARYAAWIYPANSTAPGAAGTLRLIKFQDWQDWAYLGTNNSPIQQVTLSNPDTNWHTLKLAFHGNQIAVYLDDTQLINTNDAEVQPYLTGGITAELWTDANPYTMSLDDVFVAQPVAQSITFSPLASATYGAAPFAVSATADSGLPVTFSVVSGPATITSNTVSITGAGTVTVAATQGGDATYNAAAEVDQSFAVNPAILTVAADNSTVVYGASIPSFTGELNGMIAGDGIAASYITVAVPGSGVGTYAITPGLSDPNQRLTNYTVSQTNGVLTITPAVLSAVADNQVKIYGAANPTLTGVLTGVLTGDGITAGYSTTATASSSVGGYAITPSLADPNSMLSNYTVTLIPGTLTVTPAALSAVADNQAKIYGVANPTLTGVLTGAVAGDGLTVSYSTTADATTGIGGYDITPSLGDPNTALSNYSVTLTKGTLTINPAALTLTASNATQVYGAAQPTFTGSVTGVINNDGITATYATTAQPNSGVGSYDINPSAVDPNSKLGNYTVQLVKGSLSITPASLTGTVASQSRAYGATNAPFSSSYSGFVNSDDASVVSGPISFTCVDTNAAVVDTNSPVGSYPIHVTSGQTAANYSISYVDGSLTVTPVALLVSAQDQSRAYGMTNPLPVTVYNGFVNNEDSNVLSGAPELDVQADTNSPVGTYPIVVSLGSLSNANYALSFSNATLTVTAEALTVAADSLNKTYGTANPTLTGTVTGLNPADGITVSYSTTATASSGVGGYAITPSLTDSNSALSNYTVTLTPGTLTVNPAALSAVADNLGKTYGTANPILTGVLTGMLTGDGVTASYGTAATASSGVGSYAITPSLADPNSMLSNYTVTLTPGTLTVSPAALNAVADNQVKIYGAANPTLTGELTGVVPGDGITVSYSTTADATTGVGGYDITPSLSDPNIVLSNYTVTLTKGTLTINPTALTLTANNATQVYGAVQPTFTGTVAGVVNNDGITATYATTASPTSGAGTYDINPSAVDLNSKLGNYTVQLVKGTLTITAAPTSITWTNPVDIVYGQALGDAQLNATASVPGVLTYDPPAGTVLNVTNAQVLSVTLAPTDPNYSSSSTSVLINVLPATSTAVVTASTNPALPGTAVTFTASLNAVAPGAGTPTGTVQFTIDGSPTGTPVTLSAGAAALTTSTLSHGNHTVSVAYAGDTNFNGSTNSMAGQELINTPPTAPAYTVTAIANSAYTFPTAQLLQLAIDPDGDAISLTAVTATDTNGGTVSIDAGMITYSVASGVTNAESFTYTVTDTFGASTTGLVTVNVTMPPPVTGPIPPVTIMPNGHAALALAAQPGEEYIVQGSADLQTWMDLGHVVAGADGMVRVEDSDASNYPARYYRLLYSDDN